MLGLKAQAKLSADQLTIAIIATTSALFCETNATRSDPRREAMRASHDAKRTSPIALVMLAAPVPLRMSRKDSTVKTTKPSVTSMSTITVKVTPTAANSPYDGLMPDSTPIPTHTSPNAASRQGACAAIR